MSIQSKQSLLLIVAVIAIFATPFAPPIPQDPAYHEFADIHGFLGVPNALNVVSNGLFLWVGIAGLLRLSRRNELRTLPDLYTAYFTFFSSLVLIAAGSSWYHLNPDNASLAWDRGAMTLAFMSLATIFLAERVSLRVGRLLFPVLMIAGPASIIYWYLTELSGQGDLRAYALVQFLPLLIAPLILLLFPSRYTRSNDLWWMLICYALAKLLEILDHDIYAFTGWIGGHSLKHLAAGLACLVFLHHLQRRRDVEL
ncbi:MAG: alkaline phytoceramidase [Granulosicoccus sp.]|nr:alkaline phytoceramidase [Granulosicoccus sp.]